MELLDLDSGQLDSASPDRVVTSQHPPVQSLAQGPQAKQTGNSHLFPEAGKSHISLETEAVL